MTEVVVALLSVPHDVPLQPEPDRDQVTPLFWVSLVTVAVNARVPIPACRLLLAGSSVTEIPVSEVKVTVTALAFAPLRFDVAVRVTAAGLGKLAGAV